MTDITATIADVLFEELDEHGYEDDDEKRGQVAHHLAEVVAAALATRWALIDRETAWRQYTPAYRAQNGNVIPIGSTTVSAEFAEKEAETYRSPEDETEVFVAYRDLTAWQPVDAEGVRDEQ